MKPFLAFVLALCLLLPVCALSQDDASLSAVQARGALRVGMDAQYPPFCFRDELNEEYTGFDVDLAYAVCDALGVTLEIVPIAWSEMDAALADGRVDCVFCGCAQTDADGGPRYSYPYLETSTALVVRGDSAVSGMSGLAGKTLGIREGSCELEVLRENPDFAKSLGSAYTFPQCYEMFNNIVTGAMDAALADRLAVEYRIAQGDNLKIIDGPEAAWQLAGAFPADSAALQGAVNQALVSLGFNGVLSEITSDWFGTDISMLARYVVGLEEHYEE